MATVYIDISTDVDIDEVDFMEECTEYEIQVIIKWLIKNKYINKRDTIMQSSSEIEWNNAVNKFVNNKFKLSQEEEIEILKIAHKL
jgi:phage terminase large subunit GpA-like protein